jgi:O-antigen/teichoic acid export membrane protein
VTNLADRTALAGIWTIGGKIIARMIDFVALLVLARMLSPDDFGLVAIATSILVIVETVLDLPLVAALLRRQALSEGMINTAFTMNALRGLAIALLLILLAWPTAWIYGDPRLVWLMVVISLAPAMRSVVSPKLVLFMQRFDFRREFALDVIAKGTALIASVTAASLTGSYWALAVGAVVGPTIATIVSYIMAPVRPVWTLCEYRQFTDIISWNTVAQILSSVNWQLDRLLLPRFASLAVLGMFSIADSLAGVVHQVFVGPLMRPLIAGFSHLDDRQRLVNAYLKSTSAITLVAGPILLIMCVLAEPALRLAVGEKWVSATTIFQGLCIVSLFTLPTASMPALAMVLDKTRFAALRMGLEFAIRVPTAILAIAYFDATGAIIARLVGVIVGYAATMAIVRHLIGAPIHRQVAAFGRALLPALPMLAFLLWVGPWLAAMPAGIGLAAGLCLAGSAAMAIFWAFALALWQVLGAPGGVEGLIVSKLKALRRKTVQRWGEA